MESTAVGIPEGTLDLSFGFDHPNFSDRILLLHINPTHTAAHSPPPPVKKTIYINSLILAARSPFFRKLFCNGMQESEQKNVTLHLEASEELSFMDLLKYVYSNNLPTTLDALLDLCLTADKFEVDSCSRDCTRALLNLPMTCESASIYLDLPPCLLTSPTFQPLIDSAKQFLVAKYSQHFIEFEEEVLKLPLLGFQAVLSSEDLLVNYEREVFDAVLTWLQNHYPNLEESREIMKTHLLHLVRFPFMTATELAREVQNCIYIDPELASKIVFRALCFKAETYSHLKRCLAAEEGDTASHQFVERAYVTKPVKVVELEAPHQQCVVYLDFTRVELKRLAPDYELWSETFFLGALPVALIGIYHLNESSKIPYFIMSLLDVGGTSTSTVEYEFAVRKKPHGDFERWFTGSHTFTEEADPEYLHSEELTGFIDDDSSYLINGILHVRAELTIRNE